MGDSVEKWGIFEREFNGPSKGNPFKDVQFAVLMTKGHRTVRIRGFYDGDGKYRFRFSPDTAGEWTFRTESNIAELNDHEGSFECVGPAGDNYGPIKVDKYYNFRYAEGQRYDCIGTTSYAWIHQPEELADQTFESLKNSPFDKIRMTVFLKSYIYNEHQEPDCYVFPCLKTGGGSWDGHWDSKGGKIEWEFDYSRFDLRFFHKLDRRIKQLCNLNIQADVILFHPYDRWGFAQMTRETDLFYLDYIIARISAYRNVWWSLANEWDLVHHKKIEDWEVIGKSIEEFDPYRRLTGIHNGHKWFNHNSNFITHLSIQAHHFEIQKWRSEFRKPVIIDEMGYEGNIYVGWGYLTGLEMTHRFWDVIMNGGYAGHSEVYLTPEHVMWWNKGGKLTGTSTQRIAFLKKLFESGPDAALEPRPGMMSCGWGASKTDKWIIGYTGPHQPAEVRVKLPKGKTYSLKYIDIWELRVTEVIGQIRTSNDETSFALPGKSYTAFLLEEI